MRMVHANFHVYIINKRRKCRKIFPEGIICHSKKRFSKFPHDIFDIISRHIIGLENLVLSFRQS